MNTALHHLLAGIGAGFELLSSALGLGLFIGAALLGAATPLFIAWRLLGGHC